MGKKEQNSNRGLPLPGHAAAVVNDLVNQGVSANQLQPLGMGGANPGGSLLIRPDLPISIEHIAHGNQNHHAQALMLWTEKAIYGHSDSQERGGKHG